MFLYAFWSLTSSIGFPSDLAHNGVASAFLSLGSRCVGCFTLGAQELLQDPDRRLLLLRQLRMVEIDEEDVGYCVAVVVRRVLEGGVEYAPTQTNERCVSLCNGAPRLCPRPVAEESGRKAWHSSARRMCDRKVWHSSAAASAGPAANVEVWTNAANV